MANAKVEGGKLVFSSVQELDGEFNPSMITGKTEESENADSSENNDSSNSDLDVTSDNDEGSYESHYEVEARKQGWRPEEEWSGHPDDWVDAKTFIKNGEFMSTIHKLNQKFKSQEETINNLSKLVKSQYDAGYDAAMNKLRKRKVQAISDGDAEQVLAIDDEIDQLKASHTAAEVTSEEQDTQEELPQGVDTNNPFYRYFNDNWLPQNRWYQMDSEMAQVAEEIAILHLKRNPTATPEQVYERLDKRIREEFPERFGTKAKVAKVGSRASTTRRKSEGTTGKHTLNDLTDTQRQIAMDFARRKVMSVESYIDMLAKEDRVGKE